MAFLSLKLFWLYLNIDDKVLLFGNFKLNPDLKFETKLSKKYWKCVRLFRLFNLQEIILNRNWLNLSF